jgi:phage/plasmid-like protein (TIGR03299 family)
MSTLGETTLTRLDERVGVDISNAASYDEVMSEAGFDFEVEKTPVQDIEGNEISGHFNIRRSDTKQTFAIMRKRYTAIPMEKMFRPFHEMVEKYGAKYEGAGLIGGGKKAWISAKLNDSFTLKSRADDKVDNRIMAFGSNDGTKRNAYFGMASRIFCNNQIRTIMQKANESDYWISHTKNWEHQLELARDGFEAALRGLKEFEKIANLLDQKKMTSDQCRGFTAQLLPDPERKKDEKGKEVEVRTTSRLANRREAIVDLFANGAGNLGATRWDALNGLTEWVNHHNNVGKLEKQGRQAAERRLVSTLMGGPQDQLMQRGLRLLVNTKKFDKVAQTVDA